MPNRCGDYTELRGSKTKTGNGCSQPNLEPVPNTAAPNVYIRTVSGCVIVAIVSSGLVRSVSGEEQLREAKC